jgi:hypothetical protein
MELREYNGWENKFTWLVHLRLSSEERLMQEWHGRFSLGIELDVS